MSVSRRLFAVLAACVLLVGAGCSPGDTTPMPQEIDEPAYREGQQRLREGRAPEALTWFLKVIEKRGIQNAPESHLEAGRIYLQYIKDPVEAYHHFRKYLELQPNSQQTGLVRQQMDAALREFASRLPLRPEDNQVRFENTEALGLLKRENDGLKRRIMELEAELATLRGGGAAAARAPRMITAPTQPAAGGTEPAIITAVPPRTIVPPAARTTTPSPAPRPAPAGGRTHTVERGETAWAIARIHYGSGATAAQVQGILDANRITAADLRPGMTLRIP